MNLANFPQSICTLKSPHYHDRKNCLSIFKQNNQILPQNKFPVTPIKKISEQSMMGMLEKTHFTNTVKKKKNSYFSQNMDYSSQPKSSRSNFKSPPTQNNFSKDHTSIIAPRSIEKISKELIARSKKTESNHKKKLSILKNKYNKQIKKSIKKRIETSPSHKKVEPSIFLSPQNRKPTQRLTSCQKQRRQENKTENRNHILCPANWTNEQKTINTIKKSQKNKSLVQQIPSNALFFFYFITDSQYHLINLEDHKIMKIFCDFGGKVYLLQPYQYTFNELVSLDRITPQNMSIIHQEVKAVKELIEKQIRRPAELAPISQIVYYVHGVMKILPLIRKKYLLSNAIHLKKLRSK